MISLASLYYNVRIKVIYANAASDEDALAAELNLSRQAEELLFYTRPPTGCLSNRETIREGDEAFKAAESSYATACASRIPARLSYGRRRRWS